jgi:hypothetical protein
MDRIGCQNARRVLVTYITTADANKSDSDDNIVAIFELRYLAILEPD